MVGATQSTPIIIPTVRFICEPPLSDRRNRRRLDLGTTYLIVEEIDLDAKTASLWIDPDSSTFGGRAYGHCDPFRYHRDSDRQCRVQSPTGTGSFLVDNLLIGTTWADVTPVAAPEPSTLALAGVGLLGLAARFRRTRG